MLFVGVSWQALKYLSIEIVMAINKKVFNWYDKT